MRHILIRRRPKGLHLLPSHRQQPEKRLTIEANPSRIHCTTQPPEAGSQPSFPDARIPLQSTEQCQFRTRARATCRTSPLLPFPLGFLEEPRQVAPSLPRGWPASPRAGPVPITACGQRSSSRRRRSTGRRRCRRGGGRSSAPGSPSSRAGARRYSPPPWPRRASADPGESSGTARLPCLAYCRALRGAGCPLAVEPRSAAAQRRAPPAPGPFAGSPGFPSQTILWRGQALVVGWREPRGALSLVEKVQRRRIGLGTEGAHIASAFPLLKLSRARLAPPRFPRSSQKGVNFEMCRSHLSRGAIQVRYMDVFR